MHDFIVPLNVSIQESDIQDFENKYSIIFPSSYKSFLMTYNACRTTKASFDFVENGRETGSDVKVFYGLKYGRKEYYYSLNYAYEMFKDRIPQDFIPIASDSGGNQVLMNLKDEKIWFWDHEREADTDDGEEVSMDNMSFIANNLDEFLNSLYEFEL